LLVDAIRQCADQPGDLEIMGYAARRLAEDRFDRRHSTGRFAAMLREVLDSETSSASQGKQPIGGPASVPQPKPERRCKDELDRRAAAQSLAVQDPLGRNP
jgi:hypothetical protein